MPRRQRFLVVVLFSLGFLVTAAGCVRTYYIYRSLVTEYDNTWYAYPLWIAAAIEIDMGVVSSPCPQTSPSQTQTKQKLTPPSADLRLRPRPPPPPLKDQHHLLLRSNKLRRARLRALPQQAHRRRRRRRRADRPREHAGLLAHGFAPVAQDREPEREPRG